MLRRSLFLLTFILTVAALTGCAKPKLGQYNVHVQLDDMLHAEGHDFTVDLVGTDNPQLWEAVDINRYFPNSKDRQLANKWTATLSGSDPVDTLEKKDPIWRTWKDNGVRDIVVLVDLPARPEDDVLQGLEIRRRTISLMTDTWRNGQTIRLLIKPNGIILQSPPKQR